MSKARSYAEGAGAAQPDPQEAVFVDVDANLIEEGDLRDFAGGFSRRLQERLRGQANKRRAGPEAMKSSQGVLGFLAQKTKKQNPKLARDLHWQLLYSPSREEIEGLLAQPGGDAVSRMLALPDAAGVSLDSRLVLVRARHWVEPAGGIYLRGDRSIFLESVEPLKWNLSTFAHELYHHVHHNWEALDRYQNDLKERGISAEPSVNWENAARRLDSLRRYFSQLHPNLAGLVTAIHSAPLYRASAALIETQRLAGAGSGWMDSAADEPVAYLLGAVIGQMKDADGNVITHFSTRVTDSDVAMLVELGMLPEDFPRDGYQSPDPGDAKTLNDVFEAMGINPLAWMREAFKWMGSANDGRGTQLLGDDFSGVMESLLEEDLKRALLFGRIGKQIPSGDLLSPSGFDLLEESIKPMQPLEDIGPQTLQDFWKESRDIEESSVVPEFPDFGATGLDAYDIDMSRYGGLPNEKMLSELSNLQNELHPDIISALISGAAFWIWLETHLPFLFRLISRSTLLSRAIHAIVNLIMKMFFGETGGRLSRGALSSPGGEKNVNASSLGNEGASESVAAMRALLAGLNADYSEEQLEAFRRGWESAKESNYSLVAAKKVLPPAQFFVFERLSWNPGKALKQILAERGTPPDDLFFEMALRARYVEIEGLENRGFVGGVIALPTEDYDLRFNSEGGRKSGGVEFKAGKFRVPVISADKDTMDVVTGNAQINMDRILDSERIIGEFERGLRDGVPITELVMTIYQRVNRLGTALHEAAHSAYRIMRGNLREEGLLREDDSRAIGNSFLNEIFAYSYNLQILQGLFGMTDEIAEAIRFSFVTGEEDSSAQISAARRKGDGAAQFFEAEWRRILKVAPDAPWTGISKILDGYLADYQADGRYVNERDILQGVREQLPELLRTLDLLQKAFGMRVVRQIAVNAEGIGGILQWAEAASLGEGTKQIQERALGDEIEGIVNKAFPGRAERNEKNAVLTILGVLKARWGEEDSRWKELVPGLALHLEAIKTELAGKGVSGRSEKNNYTDVADRILLILDSFALEPEVLFRIANDPSLEDRIRKSAIRLIEFYGYQNGLLDILINPAESMEMRHAAAEALLGMAFESPEELERVFVGEVDLLEELAERVRESPEAIEEIHEQLLDPDLADAEKGELLKRLTEMTQFAPMLVQHVQTISSLSLNENMSGVSAQSKARFVSIAMGVMSTMSFDHDWRVAVALGRFARCLDADGQKTVVEFLKKTADEKAGEIVKLRESLEAEQGADFKIPPRLFALENRLWTALIGLGLSANGEAADYVNQLSARMFRFGPSGFGDSIEPIILLNPQLPVDGRMSDTLFYRTQKAIGMMPPEIHVKQIIRLIGKAGIWGNASYHRLDRRISMGGTEGGFDFETYYTAAHEIGHGVFYEYVLNNEKRLRQFLKIGGWKYVRGGSELVDPDEIPYEELKRKIMYGCSDSGYFRMWNSDFPLESYAAVEDPTPKKPRGMAGPMEDFAALFGVMFGRRARLLEGLEATGEDLETLDGRRLDRILFEVAGTDLKSLRNRINNLNGRIRRLTRKIEKSGEAGIDAGALEENKPRKRMLAEERSAFQSLYARRKRIYDEARGDLRRSLGIDGETLDPVLQVKEAFLQDLLADLRRETEDFQETVDASSLGGGGGRFLGSLRSFFERRRSVEKEVSDSSAKGLISVSDILRTQASENPKAGVFHPLELYAKAFEGFGIRAKTFLGAGLDSVAIELEDGRVLKISNKRFLAERLPQVFEAPFEWGELPVVAEGDEEVRIPYFLQAKVDMNAAVLDVIAFSNYVRQFGYRFADLSEDQLGIYQGRIVSVDPFAVKKIRDVDPETLESISPLTLENMEEYRVPEVVVSKGGGLIADIIERIMHELLVEKRYLPEAGGPVVLQGRDYNWDAFTLEGYPNLVFKFAHFPPGPDSVAYFFENQVNEMSLIANAAGYARIRVDGVSLISIPGFSPFTYFVGEYEGRIVGFLVQQRTESLSAFQGLNGSRYPGLDISKIGEADVGVLPEVAGGEKIAQTVVTGYDKVFYTGTFSWGASQSGGEAVLSQGASLGEKEDEPAVVEVTAQESPFLVLTGYATSQEFADAVAVEYGRSGVEGVRDFLVGRAREQLEKLRAELDSGGLQFMSGLSKAENFFDAAMGTELERGLKEVLPDLSAEEADEIAQAVRGVVLGGLALEGNLEAQEQTQDLTAEQIGAFDTRIGEAKANLLSRGAGTHVFILDHTGDSMAPTLDSLRSYEKALKYLIILHGREQKMDRELLSQVRGMHVPYYDILKDPSRPARSIEKAMATIRRTQPGIQSEIQAGKYQVPVLLNEKLAMDASATRLLVSILAQVSQVPDRLKKSVIDAAFLLIFALASKNSDERAKILGSPDGLIPLLHELNIDFLSQGFKVGEDGGISLDLNGFIGSILRAASAEAAVQKAA